MTPRGIQGFLKKLRIKTIDYPRVGDPQEETPDEVAILTPGNDPSSVLEMLLDLTGHPFSAGVEIPVYSSRQTDFNLIIKADYFLNLDGKDSIIDLSGLEPDVITLLRDHQFLILTLAGEEDPARIVSRTLEFLGVKSDSNPHPFMATERDERRNIRLTITGITFRDEGGHDIFATRLNLPEEIAIFINRKGYRIMSLPPS